MTMNIFALAAATAVAATSIVATPAVEARENCFTTSTGWGICTRDNGRMGVDRLAAVSPDGSRRTVIDVLCTGNGGNRWESYGHLSKSANQYLANWWCADF